MRRIFLAVTCCVGAACGSNSATPPTTPQTLTTDLFTGTVNAPVNGQLQSAFNQFVVGQGGGAVSVTLTSAIETLPNGTFLPTVTMGLGAGTVTNGACVVTSGSFVNATAGSTAQLNGNLVAGTYCVQVSDVTSQLGPVAYALSVSHP